MGLVHEITTHGTQFGIIIVVGVVGVAALDLLVRAVVVAAVVVARRSDDEIVAVVIFFTGDPLGRRG